MVMTLGLSMGCDTWRSRWWWLGWRSNQVVVIVVVAITCSRVRIYGRRWMVMTLGLSMGCDTWRSRWWCSRGTTWKSQRWWNKQVVVDITGRLRVKLSRAAINTVTGGRNSRYGRYLEGFNG